MIALLADRLREYALLMRLNRPIGIFLLLWPALWALMIAGDGRPPLQIVLIFIVGVILMRSAGCVINDYADRQIIGVIQAMLLVCLLTLLAMVLAIGLVVDDAIVVVENVHRHIEMGKTRFQAAIDGARELGLPILAMTTTLVAVYAPIGFMGGLVGTLVHTLFPSLTASSRRREVTRGESPIGEKGPSDDGDRSTR